MNVFGDARLYFKLRPYLNQLKELSRMKLSTNVIGQALLTVLQMGNVLASFVPAGGKFYLAAFLGFLQIVISVLAHLRNPDGTPAAQPYGLNSADLAQYQRIFGGAAKVIVLFALALALAPGAIAQTASPVCPAGFTCTPVPPAVLQAPIAATPAAVPLAALSKIAYAPDMMVSAGGGFASPNGKFGYYSVSKSVGQSTYMTMANQYTFVAGKLETCALAGPTKEMYQFGWLVLGLTGLGGGCEGFGGNAGAAASAQAFAHIHFGKSPFGLVVTAMKNTQPGFQATIAPTWAR